MTILADFRGRLVAVWLTRALAMPKHRLPDPISALPKRRWVPRCERGRTTVDSSSGMGVGGWSLKSDVPHRRPSRAPILRWGSNSISSEVEPY